ncbi:hypothetical protein [Paractinoplanes toevensis]|nr:hypothetical protein [Actinoplanes toevensis]
MIANVRRWVDSVAGFQGRYLRWESRAVRRLGGWSVPRRWATFVLLPTLLFCCGGTVVGVPAAWVLRQTMEASRGAPSPDAAADSYLMALGYNTEDGLLPILDNDHQDDLLAEWRAYRKAMDNTSPAPSRLDFGALAVGQVVDGRAEVTTEVSATWWGTDGRAIAYSSEEYTWRFKTREDNGWQVVSVEAPTWCGGYVRLDACA